MKKVAILTTYIAPYRVKLFRILREKLDRLDIIVSTLMEDGRQWPVEWDDLDVTVTKNIAIKETYRHPNGFKDTKSIHFSWNILFILFKIKPEVVISTEMGFRTLCAIVYRRIFSNTRLIIWALLSEVTEEANGWVRKILRRITLHQADGVLVNGKSGYRYIESFGFPAKKIIITPQTVDVKMFANSPIDREAESMFRLLYCGRLIELKGIIGFTDVLNEWVKNNSKYKVEFWLAGDGPLRTDLEMFRCVPNLKLKILGHIPYERLSDIYRQCGIFTFPTLSDEWGLVINEAMASGLPILGSHYSQAVNELVEDGVNGWAFYSDDFASTYNAIEKVFATSVEDIEKIRFRNRKKALKLQFEDVAKCIIEAINKA
ncbi:MAG: hypothetical protein JM58_14350 [Peptococcaceae bacterium BICA1-8]|nr:MAG: hypothetical protein JM58_14350 [Peptococcaceae bacterium BICA1-8]